MRNGCYSFAEFQLPNCCESGKLIVRPLHSALLLMLQCSEEDLEQVFAKFGTVLEAKIPLKPGKNGFKFLLNAQISHTSKNVQFLYDP